MFLISQQSVPLDLTYSFSALEKASPEAAALSLLRLTLI